MLFALPTFTSRRMSGAISLRRECDGLPITLALGHHGPGHARNLVSKRNGGDLGRAPRQQRREPGPMLGAVNLSVADDGQRSGHEQAAQIAVSLFADAAEPVLAPTRVLLRNEPNPGREITPRSESRGVSNTRYQSGRQYRTDPRNVMKPFAPFVGTVQSHDHTIVLQNM